MQAMQQDAVNHAKKCGCSRMGGHYGDVEDGKMTREEAIAEIERLLDWAKKSHSAVIEARSAMILEKRKGLSHEDV